MERAGVTLRLLLIGFYDYYQLLEEPLQDLSHTSWATKGGETWMSSPGLGSLDQKELAYGEVGVGWR